MAMTSGKRRAFSCGHRGNGKHCHRCEQATELLKKADAVKGQKDSEAKVKEYRAEADRLLAIPRKGAPTLATNVVATSQS